MTNANRQFPIEAGSNTVVMAAAAIVLILLGIVFQLGVVVIALAAVALWQIVRFAVEGITLADVGTTMLLGLATLARVIVLIAVASIISINLPWGSDSTRIRRSSRTTSRSL